MATLGELIVTLLVNIGELFSIFIFDILVTDPLSAISMLIGGLFTGAAVAGLGYLAAGALAEAISQRIGPLARAPPQQE
jgi:hypothetical protein